MHIDEQTKKCTAKFAERIAALPCDNLCGNCPAHVVVHSYIGEGGLSGDRLYKEYGCFKKAVKSFNKNIHKGS